MASSPSSHIFRLFHSKPSIIPRYHHHRQMGDPFFCFALLIFSVSLLSFIFTAFSVYKKLSRRERKGTSQKSDTNSEPTSTVKHSVSEAGDRVSQPDEANRNHSLLLEVLPSDTTKWTSVLDEKSCDDPNRDSTDEGQTGKKKKRKAKKKKANSLADDGGEGLRPNSGSDSGLRLKSVCLYPFTSSSSRMQRKIKQQYDELVKCHESKKLTLPQVIPSPSDSCIVHLTLFIRI